MKELTLSQLELVTGAESMYASTNGVPSVAADISATTANGQITALPGGGFVVDNNNGKYYVCTPNPDARGGADIKKIGGAVNIDISTGFDCKVVDLTNLPTGVGGGVVKYPPKK